AFEPVQPARHEAGARASQETRLFTQPPVAQPAARPAHARAEEQPDPEDEAGATRTVRSAGRDRWADQPVRSARPIPADEDDEEGGRRPVAEDLYRRVAAGAALVWRGIRLVGFLVF